MVAWGASTLDVVGLVFAGLNVDAAPSILGGFVS